jgi:flavin-dependent dehydrogenase
MAALTAHPVWFIVEDAACRLDPLSSKGVLRAMMSGIAASHLIARVLDGRIAADAAAKCTSTGCPSDLYGRPCIWRNSIGSSGLPASAADADIEVRYE